MTNPLSAEQLAELQKWPTPAISNAIETFNVRSRNTGFMGPEIVCRFPDLPPIVGYAVTCKIRASIPAADDPETVPNHVWWEHIESIPGPRICVIQDLDQPARGSLWGEVNGNVHKALGCIGLITDGGVRDLDEVHDIGFQFVSKEVLVSHAYIHIVEVGKPVTVGGLTINPGDLMHADKHGAMQIPHEIAADVAEAAQRVEDRERVIINYCKSPDFSREGLKQVMSGGAPAKANTPYTSG